jgi:hypothetical protein
MDDKAQALTSFARIERESPGFYRAGWFDAFGLTDADGTFASISDDLLFQQIVARSRQHSAHLRERIASSLPHLLDGTEKGPAG